jgi:hypothetical protein
MAVCSNGGFSSSRGCVVTIGSSNGFFQLEIGVAGNAMSIEILSCVFFFGKFLRAPKPQPAFQGPTVRGTVVAQIFYHFEVHDF